MITVNLHQEFYLFYNSLITLILFLLLSFETIWIFFHLRMSINRISKSVHKNIRVYFI